MTLPVKVPLDTVAQGPWLRDCDIEGVRVMHQPLQDIVPDPTPDPDGCVETVVVTQDYESPSHRKATYGSVGRRTS